MKMPRRPPIFDISQLDSEKLADLQKEGAKTEEKGKYYHWDILRHLKPPTGLTIEEWWMGIKMCRTLKMKHIPLQDKDGNNFGFNITSKLGQELHQIDRGWMGSQAVPDALKDPHTRGQYAINALIQEAISSIQIEGAATTRKVDKEMLRTGRAPRDASEQMILNNYQTMKKLKTWKQEPLSIELILEMHRTITANTMEDISGRLRTSHENVMIIDNSTQEILHEPPPAETLIERMEILCDFANEKVPDDFIHPVIRAIILHFWLAYDHPFVDGNGRYARALFYWFMLREGYWLFEFSSISDVILNAPAQYREAYLHTETDGNDLTYFILNQAEMIKRSWNSIDQYIQHKVESLQEVQHLMQKIGPLNERQEALLAHALGHTTTHYTIEAHKNSHGIAYDTARKDLQELAVKGVLKRAKHGKMFVYQPQLFSFRKQ